MGSVGVVLGPPCFDNDLRLDEGGELLAPKCWRSRSRRIILVTREGRPAGFFLPWDATDLPADVRREIFLRLTYQISAQRETRGVTQQEVLHVFAASRRRVDANVILSALIGGGARLVFTSPVGPTRIAAQAMATRWPSTQLFWPSAVDSTQSPPRSPQRHAGRMAASGDTSRTGTRPKGPWPGAIPRTGRRLRLPSPVRSRSGRKTKTWRRPMSSTRDAIPST